MPARNSADSPVVPPSHPFDCPAGDGGACALPQPPILLEAGHLRILSTVEPNGAKGDVPPGPAVDLGGLTPLFGTRREALTRALGRPRSPVPGVPDGLLVSCSCGHLYLAER